MCQIAVLQLRKLNLILSNFVIVQLQLPVVPSISPLDYRMAVLFHYQIMYTIKTVKDLFPFFFFFRSHLTFLIISCYNQLQDAIVWEKKMIKVEFFFFFYEQLMEFTISLAYIFSSHLHSLTMMWEIPHGGEKPHLSGPLFNLAVHNHMNSNFTRRPYSRSDESETTCQEVFLHTVGKKKRMDQMFSVSAFVKKRH